MGLVTLCFLLCCLQWEIQGQLNQYWSFKPDNTAAGQVPAYAKVTLILDVVFGGTAADYIAIDYVPSLVSEIPNAPAVTTNWVPFNQYAPVPTAATVLPAPYQAEGHTCIFEPLVFGGGARLLLTATLACTTPPAINTLMTITLPWYILSANPEFPAVTIRTALWAATGGGVTQIGPLNVQTPWTTTVPETEVSALQFISLLPGGAGATPNTIAAAALTSLTVTFVPGYQLGSTGIVTLEVHGGLDYFKSGVTAANAIAIAIGPNCQTSPLSTYCCSTSYGTVTIPTTVAGEFIATGWSALSIVLGPAGCVLPADKTVTFVVPAGYLNKNPAVPLLGNAAAAGSIGFRHIDSRIMTTPEPMWMHVQRYSESWPAGTLVRTVTAFAAGAAPTLAASTIGLVNPGTANVPGAIGSPALLQVWGPSSYVIGATQPTSFSAVPENTATNSVPRWVEVRFTLASAIAPLTGPTTQSPPIIVVNANQGVIKPNYGTPQVPNSITLINPTACTSSTYFTSAWGTFYLYPMGLAQGSAAAIACGAALTSGTQIAFRIPEEALLPNLATGSVVTFDMRIIPALVNAGTLVNTAAPGDLASLMNQAGWTTTASCGTSSAPNYQAGAVNDLNVISYASRCTLVNSISAISPVTAGIMQCPVGATISNAGSFVTFVKIPEGQWATNVWPLTNYAALGPWAQSVALSGTPPVVITSWGHMFSTPMYAVVVSYPPNANSLASLAITPGLSSTYQMVFLVKVNRLTMFCSNADALNPLQFQVSTCLPVSVVRLFTTTNSAGVGVETVSGSSWGTGNCNVFVTLTQGGAVAGWYATTASPTPDSGSDDALFGLLALIAVPLLCCACLLWALWYFMRRTPEVPCPCPMAECNGMQEMYWVSQPSVPMAAYPQAVPLGAPPTTPMYLVQ